MILFPLWFYMFITVSLLYLFWWNACLSERCFIVNLYFIHTYKFTKCLIRNTSLLFFVWKVCFWSRYYVIPFQTQKIQKYSFSKFCLKYIYTVYKYLCGQTEALNCVTIQYDVTSTFRHGVLLRSLTWIYSYLFYVMCIDSSAVTDFTVYCVSYMLVHIGLQMKRCFLLLRMPIFCQQTKSLKI